MQTKIGYLVAFICIIFSWSAHAELNVTVTQGAMNPIPTALPAFIAQSPEDKRYGEQMASVVANNLKNSSLFRPINPAAFIQVFQNYQETPRFADWKAINAELLVVGSVSSISPEQLKVDFRLFDVLSQVQMTGFSYTTKKSNWRRIAHLVSDAVYERVTGEKGYFDSRIVYVSQQPFRHGDRVIQRKRLAVMDQDGSNHRYLTDGRTLVLTPRFSPTHPIITYLAYYNKQPRVYLLHIDTGRVELLGNFPGMTYAPRFSPDGGKVIFSMAREGNSDIFSMDLRTRRILRLTQHPSIDTSPSFSPDGKRITFNSDRGGTQQLYTMNVDGGNVQRISFGEGRYTTPVWSPRGDLIAFTKSYRGQFYIGVLRTDGSGERLLSQSFLDEGPTWSPNGRVLMFFRETPGRRGTGEGKTARLYSVDLTGYNLRSIPTPAEASDPAWSGLNPNY
jgi:TolB protein